MARINGSGFKMKSSPTKGKLDDFFKGLGTSLKTGQKERGMFSDKGKAERKEMRKTGESKFQYDVRRSREEEEKEKEKVETEIVVDKGYVPQEFKGEAGDKFRYRRTTNDPENYDFEFMPWEKGKGFGEWTKAGPNKPGTTPYGVSSDYGVSGTSDYYGQNVIADLYEKREAADELFDSPIEKKSPYKLGIGTGYTKKPKGSRGYKMKKNR